MEFGDFEHDVCVPYQPIDSSERKRKALVTFAVTLQIGGISLHIFSPSHPHAE
jgi:hypothetical protein